MKQKLTFPSPKLFLHQIGRARVPLTSANTQVQFQARKSIIQSHTGIEIDAYRDRPAPYQPGRVIHTGLYTHTNKPAHWTWNDETAEIKAAVGQVKPFLFAWVGPTTARSVTPDVEYYDPNFDSFQYTTNDNQCVTWMWAMGKVTNVTNPYQVNNHGMPATEFGIEATLETPLIRARWSRWRYGPYVARPSSIPNSTTLSELDRAQAESAKEWWVPCSIPDQCDTSRFWPRNLYGSWDVRGFPEHWEVDHGLLLLGPEQQAWGSGGGRIIPQYVRPGPETLNKMVIQVPGNAPPRVQWLVSKGVPGTPIDRAEIRIDNAFGNRVYTIYGFSVPEPGEKYVPTGIDKIYYMDSSSNMVWFLPENTPFPLVGAPWPFEPTYNNLSGPPMLAQGENYIETLSGSWSLGITYQFI